MADENGAAPAAADAERSLDDSLSAAYDAIMARESAPRDEPPAEKVETTEEPERTGDDRPRGPDGRFVAKEKVETPAPGETETPPVADAKPAAPAEAERPSAPEEQQPERVLIPKTWQNEARRALFTKAPPEVQRALAEREAEMEQGVAKMQQRYAGYEQLVSPIRQQLAIEGRSPEQYFEALMAADQMLRTNPHHALRQIAAMYGIDPGQALQAQPQDANPLHSELAALRQEIATLKAQPQQMAEAEVQKQVEAFAADPAHVYFPQVRGLMSALLQSEAAATLKDAYDMAVQAHPEVRKQIEAEKAAQAQAAQAEAAKKAAIEARRQATLHTATRSGAGATSAPKGHWTQTLEETANRLFAQ